jgi:hypothetical protein
MPHGCIEGPDRRAGPTWEVRKHGLPAGVGRSPPVSWSGHGRHRHGGVPGHRQGHAGDPGMTTAFDAVFGVFVAAIVAVAVMAVRWGLQRDRVARTRRPDPDPAAGTADSEPVAPGSTPQRHTP